MVSRIGQDLYFGSYKAEPYAEMKRYAAAQFPDYRSHVIETFGHTDGTFCPVAPGLIVSLHDIPTYAETFPGWEVVYLPDQSWAKVQGFMTLKQKNQGRWWIPGFEQDQDVIDCVETWLSHWVGYVEETVFDVNMLTIDPTNVIVNNYNEKVFEAFDRHGITAHVIPFRHRYFWDGGIHCITLDLARQGEKQDFFPERNCV
jgi:N-dimethylarginine dimethylaminohydrolase